VDPNESTATAAWVTAWATVGLVALAVVAAIVAGWRIREARATRKQTRDLADEVARPYVVSYMEPSAASPI